LKGFANKIIHKHCLDISIKKGEYKSYYIADIFNCGNSTIFDGRFSYTKTNFPYANKRIYFDGQCSVFHGRDLVISGILL
jgi:hypothetical protein